MPATRTSPGLPTLLAVAAACVGPATAQCLALGGGTSAGLVASSTYPADDEGRSPITPLGFALPLPGAPGSPFTHCVIDANGVLFLTNGGPAVGASTGFFLGSIFNFRGTAGASPRIAPYWDDLQAASPGTWDVRIDTSVAGRCAISWIDVAEFPDLAPPKSFQVELFATGVISFSYGVMDVGNGTTWVGVSIGDGVGDPGASDLSTPTTGAGGFVYETFPAGAFDLANSTVTFVPNGTSWNVVRPCEPAHHTSYGTGCYDIPQFDAFYQWFGSAAAAAAALTGQSMTLSPGGSGYTVTWGGGAFVPVSAAATVLPATDDAEHPVTPSLPLPTPGGAAPQLYVDDNGFVSTGPGNGAGGWNPPHFGTWDPSTNFLAAPETAWWSWHDFNPTEPGSGRITHEEVVVAGEPILCVTWNDVESYAVPETSNRSTVQLQFHLVSGIVTYVWPQVTALGTGGSVPLPEATLVGFSLGGPSADPGSIALATALPIQTGNHIAALGLAASPAAISTATTGTVVTYRTTGMPATAPGSHLGVCYLSVLPLPGVDLAFVGAPGCRAYIGSLDLSVPMVGTAPVQDVAVFCPPGLPPGLHVFAQSLALFPPNSLPGGRNAFGLVTSNGIDTLIQAF
ncbi:MAG: hypothetical protein JNM25_13415 [Planctomycetes bacterium]|nr:hypothetical protein [Planctomycetota bacterium]